MAGFDAPAASVWAAPSAASAGGVDSGSTVGSVNEEILEIWLDYKALARA